MKRLISYLDITAPKFNLFINGKSSYRTFWGGIFHLISFIILIIIFVMSLKNFLKYDPSQIVINTSEYSLNDLEKNQIDNNQTIKIDVDSKLTEYHQFYYSGYIYSNDTKTYQNKMDVYNSDSTTTNFTFNLSNIDFNHSDFFIISFPRCNNITYKCEKNVSENDYIEFINTEKNLFYFNLMLPQLSINLNKKIDDSKFNHTYLNNSVYVNKKRGMYYVVYLNLIVVEEHKGLFSKESYKKYGYRIDRVDPITVDDFSWNELSFSIFFKLEKSKTVVYQFNYDTIFSAFSFIGGLNNFFSMFFTIKNILSLHFADIFMLNYHFFNSLNGNNKEQNESDDLLTKDQSNNEMNEAYEMNEINFSANIKKNKLKELENVNKSDKDEKFLNFEKDLYIDDLDINIKGKKKYKNNYQANFAYDESQKFLGYCGFLKYKIFKCCLKDDKTKYLYLNYKWILDINYLLRMYLQIKILKGVLLTPNQKRLLENLSLIEKINVFARLNMDNFYLQTPIKNEQERQKLILREINSFITKKPPYLNEENPNKEEDESFINKIINLE